ncbi:MAG TPA: DUF4982 domain-containing protein, partial [Chitinivibrionales bacterium]
ILDVFISSSQHTVRSYSGARPCAISEYGDWDIGPCNWATTITGCADRISRSDGEGPMLTQAFNFDTSLSANRGLSWLSGDALWSAFDYQSWSNDPLTTSGALDIFRLPKYAAYFYQSQRSPTVTLAGVNSGPMVFIASQWTAASPKTVRVYSNCDQVSLYLNGTLVATQSPVSGSHVEHPRFEFSVGSFQSGTLRADGLIGGKVMATHSVTTPSTASKLAVTIDTAGLPFVADGADIAMVYASILDASGTVVPSAVNGITFAVTAGQGDLVGVNPAPAQAGIAAILLRSKTNAGPLTISASATGLAGANASVTAVNTPAVRIADEGVHVPQAALKELTVRRLGSMLIFKRPLTARGEKQTGIFTLCNTRGERVGLWDLAQKGDAINLAAIPRGVYLCRLEIGDNLYARKILW